MFQYLQSVKVD